MELRKLKSEERAEANKALRNKIKNDYLVCVKDYSDYVKRDRNNKIEISQNLLKNFDKYGEIKRVYRFIPAFSIKIDERIDFENSVKAPDLEDAIQSVERNLTVSIPDTDITPAKGDNDKLWNLEMVEAYKARGMSKGSGTVVAVVDTGADYRHPEIERNYLKHKKGYNVIEDSDDPFDDNGHGTHCSGIIAGENVGVAPSVTLKAVKFLNEWGSGTTEDAVTSIEWCIEEDVDITSNSWGGGGYSRALELVFDEAWNRNILNVAAAGNTGRKDRHYPSAYKSVISVPAVDRNEQRAYFSTISEVNEVSAPGVEIYSCVPGKSYEKLSGTSMACPHVSGGAACVKAFYKAGASKVRQNLKKHAKRLGTPTPNEEYGYGLLQVHKTLIGFI